MEKVINLIAQTFDVDPQTIGPETACDTINGWDSLGVLTLVSELEQELGISVQLEKVSEIRFVKDLFAIIEG